MQFKRYWLNRQQFKWFGMCQAICYSVFLISWTCSKLSKRVNLAKFESDWIILHVYVHTILRLDIPFLGIILTFIYIYMYLRLIFIYIFMCIYTHFVFYLSNLHFIQVYIKHAVAHSWNGNTYLLCLIAETTKPFLLVIHNSLRSFSKSWLIQQWSETLSKNRLLSMSVH